MWLHEGFGTYMQPLYIQYLRGDMEYYANLMKMRAKVCNKTRSVSGNRPAEEDVYDPRGGPGQRHLHKGALTMHTCAA